jgi:hypothetical protein
MQRNALHYKLRLFCPREGPSAAVLSVVNSCVQCTHVRHKVSLQMTACACCQLSHLSVVLSVSTQHRILNTGLLRERLGNTPTCPLCQQRLNGTSTTDAMASRCKTYHSWHGKPLRLCGAMARCKHSCGPLQGSLLAQRHQEVYRGQCTVHSQQHVLQVVSSVCLAVSAPTPATSG